MPRAQRLAGRRVRRAARLVGSWKTGVVAVGEAQSARPHRPRSPASTRSCSRPSSGAASAPIAAGGRLPSSGVKGRPNEAYFGATGGGLWKTTDGGENWAPVTDGQIKSASVGAVAVSESNPDIVFIGMGESCIRGNIMPGDGVYKSTDAGKTWTHVGFSGRAGHLARSASTRPIPTSSSSPSFGKYGVPNDERGVFKSTDGGKTWQRKCCSATTRPARSTLAIDRKNPNVMYAALWEAYRVEYQMSSGGPGSGLFKSTDGGETWTEITRNPGLPAGVVGRIGVVGVRRRFEPRLRARRERERRPLRRRTMPARRGRSSTATATSASARSTTRTSPPIRSARTRSTC